MFTQRSRGSRLKVVAVAAAALIAGLWLGGHPSWLPGPLRSAFVSESANDQVVNDVLGLLAHDYYRRIDRNALLDRGLAAAVASLNDPYSHYFDRADYRAFENQDSPHLSGIGIDVQIQRRGLLVLDVFPASPAARAGLGHGDLITHVGSTSLANHSQESSASLIKGRAGTLVTLTVLAGGHTRVVSVRRANLTVPVTAGRLVRYHGKKIGVVALTSFTQGSGAELRGEVDKVLRQGAQGLILDLRENGGGLLEEAVNVASIFIADGTVVSTDGRSQPRQVYLAKGRAIAAKIPVVVLVDHRTASAAEIVTGALQDRGRAKVVGTHTYGKGVFQQIQPLPNGGALDFTIGEYFTPSGRNLGGGGVRRGAGITPDIHTVTNLRAKVDTALRVAERTVAAQIR
ncbi:MAG: S41 family peptidase [Actinomycetota bacterium]|nr:S41 family peptidase [Actinomycetota bacterium]